MKEKYIIQNKIYTDVIVVSLTPFFGGGESYILRLVNILNNQFRLKLLVRSSKLKELLIEKNFNAELITFNNSISVLFFSFLKILALYNKRKHCWVILNGQVEANLVIPLRVFGFRTLIVRHTSLDLTKSLLKKCLYWISAMFTNRIVVVSKQSLDEHEFLKSKVTLIYNWINEDSSEGNKLTVKNLENMHFCSESFPLRVVYIGRLVKEKGIEELLSAVSQLKNIILDIFGEGPLVSSVEEARKTNNRIIYHGFKKEANNYLPNYDVLVLPSYSEGMPISVIDAFAIGLTCVLSNISSLRDISDDGRAAILFDVGDSKDLACKLALLRDTPNLRREIGISGNLYALKMFNFNSAREMYLNILNK